MLLKTFVTKCKALVLFCVAAWSTVAVCEAQCPVNPVPGSSQDTPVAAFVQAAHRGDLEAVNAALKAGVDINAAPEYGWTALHSAAERSHVEVLKRLIEAGANVNAKEYLDVTPLHWAAARGPLEAVKALIDAGADVNAYCTQHDTPLAKRRSTPDIGQLASQRLVLPP